MCVNPVQQGPSIFAPDVQLAESADVDDADPLTHRQAFLVRRAVAAGSLPRPRLHHVGPQFPVNVVQRRALHGHVRRPCQRAQRHRFQRRARCRNPDGLRTLARVPGAQTGQRLVAHLPLAWAHGRGAVPLQQLDVVETFPYSLRDVLDGHVFAKTDEFFLTRGLRMETVCDAALPSSRVWASANNLRVSPICASTADEVAPSCCAASWPAQPTLQERDIKTSRPSNAASNVKTWGQHPYFRITRIPVVVPRRAGLVEQTIG